MAVDPLAIEVCVYVCVYMKPHTLSKRVYTVSSDSYLTSFTLVHGKDDVSEPDLLNITNEMLIGLAATDKMLILTSYDSDVAVIFDRK